MKRLRIETFEVPDFTLAQGNTESSGEVTGMQTDQYGTSFNPRSLASNPKPDPDAKTAPPKNKDYPDAGIQSTGGGNPFMESWDNVQANKVLRDDSGNVRDTTAWAKTAKTRKQATVMLPGQPEIIFEEITTGQTGIVYGLPLAPIVMITDPTVIPLYKKYPTTYDEYRKIRKDPTISLCRAVIAGAILAGSWSIEKDDEIDDEDGEEIIRFIRDQLFSKRYEIMEHTVLAGIDFGWMGFEKVFETIDYEPLIKKTDSKTGKVTTTTGPAEKRIGLRKLKPLLHDMTSIMVYMYNGDFAGFRQGVVFIEAPRKALLISFRVEGTMWHGYSLMEDAKDPVYKWNDVEVGAARFDRKVAGSHWVIHFPPGKSKFQGVLMDNGQIAGIFLHQLEASGSLTIPTTIMGWVEGQDQADQENARWKIELLEAKSTRQQAFVDRSKYLDTLKIRACHIPERAITEGQFGTKAEAETHGDVMTVLLENMDTFITSQINMQVVDHLLELNFGKKYKGKVRLKPSPITDSKVEYLQSVFSAILTNANGFTEIFPHIDIDQILDLIGMPKEKEVASRLADMQQSNPLTGGQPGMPGMAPNGMPQPANGKLGALKPEHLQALQQLGISPAKLKAKAALNGPPQGTGNAPVQAPNFKPMNQANGQGTPRNRMPVNTNGA